MPQLRPGRVKQTHESESHSVTSNSLQPHGLYSPWNSPGQNTGVGSLSLLQGIIPTQGSNPGLPHCRQIIYQLSYQRSPNRYININNFFFKEKEQLYSREAQQACNGVVKVNFSCDKANSDPTPSNRTQGDIESFLWHSCPRPSPE